MRSRLVLRVGGSFPSDTDEPVLRRRNIHIHIYKYIEMLWFPKSQGCEENKGIKSVCELEGCKGVHWGGRVGAAHGPVEYSGQQGGNTLAWHRTSVAK